MRFRRQNSPPPVEKPEERLYVEKEEAVTDLSERDVNEEHGRHQEEQRFERGSQCPHEPADEEQIDDDIRGEVVRIAQMAHERRDRSLEEQPDPAKDPDQENDPEQQKRKS